MHVWQISSFGIDSLDFVERPNPEPGPGQVVVRVHAISFNFRDLMMVKGLYNPKLKLPRIPCSDGAGEVLAVGHGVTRWRPGDRVAGIFMQNWIDGPPTPDKIRGALGPSRAAGAQPADSTLQVTVSNVRMAAGHIRVVVCTRASFLTETCPFRGMTPAQVGPSS